VERAITVERRGAVALVTLNRGGTNAIDRCLVTELGLALDELVADESARALVLASASPRMFSIGFDIPSLLELEPDEMRSFFRSFILTCLALYELPMPTVAAIERHAVAGGCILAACCDYRLIAEGRTLMGIATSRLGVPVPHVAGLLLLEIVGARAARDMLDSGEFLPPPELLRIGMVDRILPRAEVEEAATAHATRLGELPAAAFAATKSQRTARVADEVRRQLDARTDQFVRLWFSEEARVRLEAAREKF